MKRFRSEISVGFAIVVLLIVLAFLAPSFFTRENLTDLALANMPVLIVALGMTLIVLTGHIDISVGTMFAICSVAAGEFAKLGLPAWGAGLAACAIGAMLGAINGALVAYLHIPSIVVTLAAMVAFRDALRWITQGAWVQDLPANFQWLGMTQAASNTVTFLIAGILAIGIGWGLRNLPAGRSVYATGSNANAARLVGIDSALVTFSVFTITGALTGCAALLNSVRFNQVPSNAGIGMELKVITAVVVGGTVITGGRGSIQGTLLGVVLLGIVSPMLTFLGFSAYWERAIQGLIILCAVGFDAVRSRLGKYAGDFAERTA
ncbi:MAG TPA: ABC transporter permease [Bryobacteraceae bacterium]|nr:ABC transporter permease [Bryobacteraceae bacterium]